MVKITIPEEYQLGFFELLRLDEGQARGLLSALKEVRPTRNRMGLRESVASKVGATIDRPDLTEILDTLVSLFGLQDSLDLATPEFVNTVSEAMERSELESLAFASEENRESFEALLAEILEVDNLAITAKAISLVYEQDHIVHGGFRVLTDLRPVFGSDPADASTLAAMVTYTLNFEYHEGSEIKELFASLNARQVDELIRSLERAKVKAESLERALEGTPIRYVDAE